jgi:hypothetical protein
MSINHEERPSYSSYVESIMYGRTLSDDPPSAIGTWCS